MVMPYRRAVSFLEILLRIATHSATMGKAPAAARRKLNITPYTHAESEAMADIRVLIVEDDADINHIVATHLSRCGYACT